MKKALALAACVCLLTSCNATAAAKAEPVKYTPVQLNSHPKSYSYDGWQSNWISSGQYAWLTVIPAKGVIPRTQDFVATRMLAKFPGKGDDTKWLEVGYATTGMTDGHTYVYTWDTGSQQWHFYPEYPLRENMQIQVGLFSNDLGIWTAYLKYDGVWFPLVTCVGAGQQRAYFEYYVETHYDKNVSNHAHIIPPLYNEVIDDRSGARNAR